MILSEATKLAIERYTAQSEERARGGSMKINDWEDARSYAVEALQGILYDNPDLFDYKARVQKILDEQKKRVPTSSTNGDTNV